VRDIAEQVVAEMLRPAAERMAALEHKLAVFERLAADAQAARSVPVLGPVQRSESFALPTATLSQSPPAANAMSAIAPAPQLADGFIQQGALFGAAAMPFEASPLASPLETLDPAAAPMPRALTHDFASGGPRTPVLSVSLDEFPGLGTTNRQRNLWIAIAVIVLLSMGGLLASMIASRSGS
jgi:hypothetical protein